jgi:hypothetical protein
VSAARVAGIVIGVLLLLLVGGFVYFATHANAIVRNAVEALGGQYVGVPVRVGAVNVSLQEGRVTLSDLEIGNPPGYVGPFALRLHDVSATLDAAASNSALIVLKTVTVAGVEVAAVAKSTHETNVSALAAGVPRSNATSMRVNVDSLDLSNVHATLASPLSPVPIDVAIADIHLAHVGSASGGQASGELIRQVLDPIARAVALAAVNRGVGDAAIGSTGANGSQALERMRGTLQSLGHPVN